MKYCYECGERLTERELENEGIVQYCEKCGEYRFPIFSTAVSMIVENPDKTKILLIQQYGRKNNILVAGYVNKGENAESAVVREVMEETGLKVSDMSFNKSEYFAKNPKIVPTGQTVLHQVRPPRHAKTAISTKVTAATTKVVRHLIHTSTV